MLDQLRQGAQGWVSKILMALLVISFAIWGIGGFEGYGAGTLATVGDEEITIPEFARAHQRAQEQALQSGQQVQSEQVLQQLLLNAALDDEASDFKLGVSDDYVAQELAKQEVFHNAEGKFDRERFNLLLQNAGIDRDDYVRDVRQEAVRAQIATSIAAGLDAPQPLVEALYRFQNEERTVSYVVLDQSVIAPVGTPDAAALETYFEANKERFRAPEHRKLALLTLDPAAIADPKAVTEEEISAEYERRKESFTRPERRRIELIAFPTKEEAEKAAAGTKTAAEFAALAKAEGVAPENLDQGLKTKAEFLDPAVAEAAFAAAANSVVPVLEGAVQPSIVHVTEIEPGSVTPLAEVSDRLRQDLATRAARDKIQDLYDEVEDERAGGATLEEIGTRMSLPYRVVEGVSREGTGPDGKEVADLPARDQLLTEAFESDVGVENDAIRPPGDSMIFYEVLEVVPERERTLDEVREEVTKAWTEEETQNRIAEKADALLARLQKGESLQTVAAEIGKPVMTAEGVTRNQPPAGLGPNAAAQAFAGPEGHLANAEADTPPARILLKVDKVTAPAFFAEAAGVANLEEQLGQAIARDMLSSYNRQLLAVRDTSVNQAAYAQLSGTQQTQ
jgi:peptidyl-prolyl cis-trans isomerase D